MEVPLIFNRKVFPKFTNRQEITKCFCKLRKKNNLTFLAVVSIAIFSLSFIVFSVSSQIKSDEIEQQKPLSPVDEKPHNVVAAFYDVQNFPSAKLLLNNKDIVAREVRPTLYNLDGNIMEVAPVMVQANSHLMINLQDWASLGGESFRQGSLKLFHTGKDLVIGSQIYLEDAAQGLSFEERLGELGRFDSRRLESIWWMPRNRAQVTIILSNTSEQTLSVTAKLSRKPRQIGEPQTFTLLPHQTRVLDLQDDFTDGDRFANSEIVGLSLEHTGEKSALKAHGQIKDPSAGYSNIIGFSNPNTAKSSELHGTGLHLSPIGDEELEPLVIVKNVSDEPTNVTAKVPYTRANGTSGRVNLAAINLRAGEMRLLNMNSVIERSRQEQIQIAGIEIKYDTEAGSVLVNTLSVSNNRRQMYRVPMSDPFAQVSSTGGYPWRIEETSSTFAYIKNTTNLEQEYVAYLTWANGGEYMIGLKTIFPHETVEIDVRKLRDEQIADERGNAIPLNINDGQIKWTIRSEKYINDTDVRQSALIGRSEQIDTTNGISSSYACQNCCQKRAYATIFPYTSVADVEVGDQIQFGAREDGFDCYGYEYNYFLANNRVTWSSSRTSIAAVNSLGLVIIVGAGDDVNIRGEWGVDVSANYGGDCPILAPEESKVKSELQEKQAAKEIYLPPDCSECYTLWRRIDHQVGIDPKPKVTINVPPTALDGATVTFNVTTQGGTPTAYLWSFSSPSGSGNNPQVNFTSPSSAMTTAQAHWFARPNTACGADYDSRYTIKVRVSFQGRSPITKEAPFTVSVGRNWGGKVDAPTTLAPAGTLALAFDNERGLWTVVGPGSLQRVPSPIEMRTPTNSQFYNKTLRHEQVHEQQYIDEEGIFSDLYQIDNVMPRLFLLTDKSKQVLEQRAFQAVQDWRVEQDEILRQRLRQAEIEAYDISDPIEPLYLFQRACVVLPN